MKNIISIDSPSIVRVILWCLFFYVLFILRDIVLILLTAVVLASATEPFTHFFEKRKVPRVLAVIIIYAVAAFGLFSAVYFLGPTLLDDSIKLLSAFPDYLKEFSTNGIVTSAKTVADASLFSIPQTIPLESFLENLQASLTSFSGGVTNTVAFLFGGVFSFVLIAVLSFYLSVQKDGIASFLRIVTPHQHEKYVIDLWKRSQNKIAKWMQGQMLLGLIIGILVYLGLSIIGIKHALVFAILAMVFEIIPIFGPILAAIPAISVAFSDGGTTLALVVLLFYVVIQQFENHLIYPLVVNKVVGVPSILVILALVIGAKLAGFLGIILSVPLMAVLVEFMDDVGKKNKNRTQELQEEGS